MKDHRIDFAFALLCMLLAIALPALILGRRRDGGDTEQNINLFIHESGETLTLSLEEYVAHITAAVTEDNTPREALSAVAVSLRTGALLKGNGSCGHRYCDDPEHCFAYSPYFSDNCAEAVKATAGKVLIFNGSLLPAAIHKSSYLVTGSAADTVGTDIPCLTSVITPETVEPVEFRFDLEKLKLILDVNFGVRLSFGDDIITVPNASGRVGEIRVGDSSIPPSAFARALALPSLCFTSERTDNIYIFTVRGEGSGLGLSIDGASVLAQNGSSYTDILAHYYRGCEIQSILDIPGLCSG